MKAVNIAVIENLINELESEENGIKINRNLYGFISEDAYREHMKLIRGVLCKVRDTREYAVEYN